MRKMASNLSWDIEIPTILIDDNQTLNAIKREDGVV